MTKLDRGDLFQRLKYTLLTAEYSEIDEILQTLIMKENISQLYRDFFQNSSVDSEGRLIRRGFFASELPSAGLDYAMYNLLGWAPDTFLLKHQIRRIEIYEGVGVAPHFIIPGGLFSLPSLEILHICGMGIVDLPALTANCPSLKHLDLSRNLIQNIPSDFFRFSRLNSLSLEYNHLETLPVIGTRLPMLKHLKLKGNRFRKFPESVKALRQLKVLDLSYNHLTSVPDQMAEMNSLRHLQLAFNDMDASVEASWEAVGQHLDAQINLNF